MTTTEERLSRLEAGYEHLATKADVEGLRAGLETPCGRTFTQSFGKSRRRTTGGLTR